MGDPTELIDDKHCLAALARAGTSCGEKVIKMIAFAAVLIMAISCGGGSSAVNQQTTPPSGGSGGSSSPTDANIAGTWKFTVHSTKFDSNQTLSNVPVQQGAPMGLPNGINGYFANTNLLMWCAPNTYLGEIFQGTVSGNTVTFQLQVENDFVTFTGNVSNTANVIGTTMSGSYKAPTVTAGSPPDYGCTEGDAGTWIAERTACQAGTSGACQ